MKNIFLSAFLFFSIYVFSQQYDCGSASQLKVYDFVSKNLDAIKNATKKDIIVASIECDDTGTFKGVRFYPSFEAANRAFETAKPTKGEVKVWQGLKDFIAASYPFCPYPDYEKEFGLFLQTTYSIPLTKEGLEAAIRETGDLGVIEKESGLALPVASNFTVTVNKIDMADKALPGKNISGKLNGYESGTLMVAPNIYLVFNVYITSSGGIISNKLAYKVFRISSGKAMLITKGWSPVENNKAHLSESAGQSVVKDDENSADAADNLFNFDIEVVFE